jgi:alkylation response protein AidB-like acyl-CoA dehydrogenase
MLGAGRAYLYDVFEEAWEEAVAARPITMKMRAKMQLASTNAVLESAEAVDLVHAIVGASGIREEYAFSKHFRDIHVITQHGFINASKLESVGQIMLGLEPEWPFFPF